MGNSRKDRYHTTDNFHILAGHPSLQNVQNALFPYALEIP